MRKKRNTFIDEAKDILHINIIMDMEKRLTKYIENDERNEWRNFVEQQQQQNPIDKRIKASNCG